MYCIISYFVSHIKSSVVQAIKDFKKKILVYFKSEKSIQNHLNQGTDDKKHSYFINLNDLPYFMPLM